MRKAARGSRGIATAKTASIAAPIGGWNARDALGAMDKLDAVRLTNLWPANSDVRLRYGYSRFATGITGQVETLFTYSGGATNKLFAAAGTSIYDVTAGGAISGASLSSLTNARWQHVNMTTAGGSYVLLVNNADKLRTFDGSAWHKDGDGAPYDITNVNSANCSNIVLFKNRVWLIQANTLKAWYLPINAIGGAATVLDMSSLVMSGGHLVAAGTWTLDAGYGVDDYLVFATSNGEVLVWRLTDPTTPSGIALIGVWELGSPIGRRCMMKYGGDLLIITQDGVVPLASALQSSRLNPRVALTDKIQFAVSEAVSEYGSNFGWQLLYFAKENQLYLNVPVSEGSSQVQYVMNTITKAWCDFSGWAANCWEIYNDNPYFGGNGFVGKAWDGLSDNSTNINAFGIQAFNYLGSPAIQKQFTMIRPNLLSDGSPQIFGGVNVDFDTLDHTTPLTFSGSSSSYGIWGTGIWDGAIWGSDVVTLRAWQGANAIGNCAAPVLKVASQGLKVRWAATDLLWNVGGAL